MATNEAPTSTAEATTRSSRRTALLAFTALAWLVVCGIVVQTLFAGLASFDMPEAWGWHARFVVVVQAVALLLVITALLGRLRGLRWRAAVLLGLIGLQHGSAALGGLAGGLHTVNALLLTVLSVAIALRATREA